jgi:hypothetical protein
LSRGEGSRGADGDKRDAADMGREKTIENGLYS